MWILTLLGVGRVKTQSVKNCTLFFSILKASLRLKISYKYKDQSGLGSVLVLHHLVTLSQCYCVTLLQCHSVTVLQCYCVTVLLYYCATVLLCWGQTSDCSHNSPVSRQGSPTNLSRILPWERFTIWLKIGKLNLNRFVNMLAISFHDKQEIHKKKSSKQPIVLEVEKIHILNTTSSEAVKSFHHLKSNIYMVIF